MKTQESDYSPGRIVPEDVVKDQPEAKKERFFPERKMGGKGSYTVERQIKVSRSYLATLLKSVLRFMYSIQFVLQFNLSVLL